MDRELIDLCVNYQKIVDYFKVHIQNEEQRIYQLQQELQQQQQQYIKSRSTCLEQKTLFCYTCNILFPLYNESNYKKFNQYTCKDLMDGKYGILVVTAQNQVRWKCFECCEKKM